MALLERTFLIRQVPGWGRKLGTRVLKSGKLLFADTGLASALLHLPAARLATESIAGPMLENFVIGELLKQASWHEERPEIYHFRTPKGFEVDAVVEFEDGDLRRGLPRAQRVCAGRRPALPPRADPLSRPTGGPVWEESLRRADRGALGVVIRRGGGEPPAVSSFVPYWCPASTLVRSRA